MRVLLVPTAFAFVALSGCSTVLGFDDVSFDDQSTGPKDAGDASSAGGSGGTTGSAGQGGAQVDASTDDVSNDGDATGDAEPDVCDGVLCSGHGDCVIGDAGVASCQCHAGHHADGLQCLVDESCDGVDCGRCGQCEVLGGKATCTCPDGMAHDGTRCVPDPDPCDSVDCGPDGVCVPEAHCQPLGACVPTCDCSNCGNCGPDNSDHRWDDWQEYCGALPDQSPATTECAKPCPPGDGCLPYAQPMCWPMEGCFSL